MALLFMVVAMPYTWSKKRKTNGIIMGETTLFVGNLFDVIVSLNISFCCVKCDSNTNLLLSSFLSDFSSLLLRNKVCRRGVL